ncbi:hypothetical protein AB0K92_22350 [Streptomyces sp. NPDC052687]|nr:hypothetical protein [Streptomyces sp. JB150]QIJ61274.1 hypothetical protein G7Z13_03945 [Streptomyces sp. JB150]
MAEHVHVRISQGLAVSESGELVEHSACRCGATFTRIHPVPEEGSER